MTKQVSDMTNEELNRIAAVEVLKLKKCVGIGHFDYYYSTYVNGEISFSIDVKDFDPADKQDHAFLLQAEIKRRELKILYLRNLCEALGLDYAHLLYEDELFYIANATPRQRTEAAIKAVQSD